MFRHAIDRLRKSNSLAVALACLLLGFATSAYGLTQAELDMKRDQWNAAGSENYDYFLQRLCFCAPESIRRGLVEVRSGIVTTVTDAETLQPLDPQDFLTVDGLFNELQIALNLPAFAIDAQFDDTLGYPQSIHIDFSEPIADDEIAYTARNLTLVPEPTGFMLVIVGAIYLPWQLCRRVLLRGPHSAWPGGG